MLLSMDKKKKEVQLADCQSLTLRLDLEENTTKHKLLTGSGLVLGAGYAAALTDYQKD